MIYLGMECYCFPQYMYPPPYTRGPCNSSLPCAKSLPNYASTTVMRGLSVPVPFSSDYSDVQSGTCKVFAEESNFPYALSGPSCTSYYNFTGAFPVVPVPWIGCATSVSTFTYHVMSQKGTRILVVEPLLQRSDPTGSSLGLFSLQGGGSTLASPVPPYFAEDL